MREGGAHASASATWTGSGLQLRQSDQPESRVVARTEGSAASIPQGAARAGVGDSDEYAAI